MNAALGIPVMGSWPPFRQKNIAHILAVGTPAKLPNDRCGTKSSLKVQTLQGASSQSVDQE
eukprot:54174-Amphidinium_carterae.1